MRSFLASLALLLAVPAPIAGALTLLNGPGCDLNGDARDDVVTESPSAVRIQLLGGPPLAVIAQGYVSTSGGAFALAACGDVNGDGKDDLVFNGVTASVTRIDLMDGTAVIFRRYLANGGGSFPVVLLGDLNGDGKDDLIQQSGTGVARITLMTAIDPPQHLFLPGGWQRVLAAADFDGDGVRELVAQGGAGGRIIATLVSLAGAAFAMQGYLVLPDGGETVGPADLDADGKDELLASSPIDTVLWQIGQQSGSWAALDRTTVSSGDGAFPVRLLDDVDGDGRQDLIGERDDGTSIRIDRMDGTVSAATTYLGNGDGAYHARQTADVDGDGRAEILLEGASFLVIQRADGVQVPEKTYLGNGSGVWRLLDLRAPAPLPPP